MRMGKIKTYLRQLLLIVFITAIGTAGLYLLFLGIFIGSLPFTLSGSHSAILGAVITMGLVIIFGTYALLKKKGRKTEF